MSWQKGNQRRRIKESVNDEILKKEGFLDEDVAKAAIEKRNKNTTN